MTSSVIPKKVLILAIVLPLAAFLGIQLADQDFEAWGLVLLLAGVLCIPLLLKWHHPFLVFCWNLPMTLFFLPGNPSLWMAMGFVSLGMSILAMVMDKETKLIHVPSLTWAMIGLVLVVLFTMKMTGGGLGLRSLGGSSFGGRKYFYILFAVVGYFAISCRRIPSAEVNKNVAFFFLPGTISLLSNFIYLLGPGLWFLYYLIPVDYVLMQAADDFGGNPYSLRIGRVGGLAVFGTTVFSYLLARYGIRGLFAPGKLWRALALAVVIVLGLMGGFRSVLITFALLFSIQFFLEGLHKTRLLPAILAVGLIGFLALIPFAQKLPLAVQRCLTVLPIEVNPAIRADAKGSTEWRLQMWQSIIPEIPKYLWVGKGYTTRGSELYLTAMAGRFGIGEGHESSLASGDFHNGPLSVIIPFGIWGALAFLFFIGASVRVLYLNYSNGDPSIKHINTFLLAAFLARVIFFFFVFGAVHTDVPILAGLVALSVSLNGGVCREPVAAPAQPAPEPVVGARIRPRRWVPVRA